MLKTAADRMRASLGPNRPLNPCIRMTPEDGGLPKRLDTAARKIPSHRYKYTSYANQFTTHTDAMKYKTVVEAAQRTEQRMNYCLP